MHTKLLPPLPGFREIKREGLLRKINLCESPSDEVVAASGTAKALKKFLFGETESRRYLEAFSSSISPGDAGSHWRAPAIFSDHPSRREKKGEKDLYVAMMHHSQKSCVVREEKHRTVDFFLLLPFAA